MIKKQIQLSDEVTRNNDVLTTDLDGEIGMIHIETGKYYSLQHVSTSIWNLIDTPIRVSQIVDKLMDEYEVDEDTCATQTLQLLNTLIDLNLVHLITPGNS